MDVLLGANESDLRGLIGRYANELVADGDWIQTQSSSKPDVTVVTLERAGVVLQVTSIASVDYYEEHTGMMDEAISPAQISAALKESRNVVLLRLSTNVRPWSESTCAQ